MIFVKSPSFKVLLNQARAWFPRIASVHECLHACVSAPEAINKTSVIYVDPI